MWKCLHCGNESDKKPRHGHCNKCGLVQAGEATIDKYDILKKYINPLSRIITKRGWSYTFIDATAGTGQVQYNKKNSNNKIDSKLIDGSPLIFMKNYEIKKDTNTSSKCIFIESNKKAHQMLKETLSIFPEQHYSCVFGDCNKEIYRYLDNRTFAFVYIDPFGLGNPTIEDKTLRKILERQHTELFIHFSTQGVTRAAGNVIKNRNSSDDILRKGARTTEKTLDVFIPGWQDIKLSPLSSVTEYVNLFEDNLKKYEVNVQYVEMPIDSPSPYYYLFYTTRNKTGTKIMKSIIEKKRRKLPTLNKWMDKRLPITVI